MKEEIVVHCRTKEQFKVVLDTYETGQNIYYDDWDIYEKDTCVRLDLTHKNYGYSYTAFYKERNHKIVSFEECMDRHYCPPQLRATGPFKLKQEEAKVVTFFYFARAVMEVLADEKDLYETLSDTHGGETGIVNALIGYAEIIDEVLKPRAEANDNDFPGVFEYEVVETGLAVSFICATRPTENFPSIEVWREEVDQQIGNWFGHAKDEILAEKTEAFIKTLTIGEMCDYLETPRSLVPSIDKFHEETGRPDNKFLIPAIEKVLDESKLHIYNTLYMYDTETYSSSAEALKAEAFRSTGSALDSLTLDSGIANGLYDMEDILNAIREFPSCEKIEGGILLKDGKFITIADAIKLVNYQNRKTNEA